MSLIKQTTAKNRAFLLVGSSDHITGLTGASGIVVQISKNAGAFTSPSLTATEIGNGWYYAPLTTTDTATLGDLAFHITATSADPTDFVDLVVADLPGASVSSVTGSVGSVSAGVTVSTNNDKTGYTASTVQDKTGYSLTQAFPSNFASLGINSGGQVTASSSSSVLVSGSVTVGTNNDKTGYTLTAQERGSIVSSAQTTVMPEGYAAKGTTPTLAQMLYEMRSHLTEKSINATSVSLFQVDGATIWGTATLDSTTPTMIHRGS